MTQSAFSSLPLSDALLDNLNSLGYEQMTPIQAQALPAVLDGQDVIGQAKTGSGKTAVFGLGVLSKLDTTNYHIQALVICPTRELADQVAVQMRRLARSIGNVKVLSLCGGVAFGPQANSLESGAHIIVGTPGRIEDHIKKKTIDLNQVESLVLDEADRMLDMGFQDALDAIVSVIPKQRQTLLFSATFPPTIESISARVMSKPQMVKIAQDEQNIDIEQAFHKIESADRVKSIRLLLMEYEPQSCVIFCNTKQDTEEVAAQLREVNFEVLALHGDLDQRERDLVLIRFANKSASILVATDVAARGLDIEQLDVVINYEIARDLDVHIHRIGRTGRAGSVGKAFTLYTHKELAKLKALGDQMNMVLSDEPLPAKSVLKKALERPKMITVQIGAGKKQKIRPGDILGALTGDDGIQGSQVGKIHITPYSSFVAVERSVIKKALGKLQNGKIKGRSLRVRTL